jgi:hypothetical protein
MIKRLFDRVRNIVKPPPYNPVDDPIHQVMRHARIDSLEQVNRSRRAVRDNQLESAYMRRRLEGEEGSHGIDKRHYQ